MDGVTAPKLEVIYSAPGYSAPSPEQVQEKLDDKANIIFCRGVLIIKVAPQVVVKFGPHVQVQEAKTMIYVAENTSSVPMPTLFACYRYGPIDRDIDDYGSLFDTYIFMSMVEGQTLDVEWESYDESTKLSVASQLATSVREFRDLRPANGSSYIGSVDHGPVMDSILSQHSVQGPFDTEEDFNKTIIDAYESNSPKCHIRTFLTRMLFQNSHRIVFTHGDFRPRNIMVKDGKLTAIIDWELAGWYPEYWEFTKSLYVWRWQNDWFDYLVKILQPYYAEYGMHSFVAQTLW